MTIYFVKKKSSAGVSTPIFDLELSYIHIRASPPIKKSNSGVEIDKIYHKCPVTKLRDIYCKVKEERTHIQRIKGEKTLNNHNIPKRIIKGFL